MKLGNRATGHWSDRQAVFVRLPKATVEKAKARAKASGQTFEALVERAVEREIAGARDAKR